MPELPEVETVKNVLLTTICNTKIEDIDVYYDNIIQNVSIEDFKKSLIGETLKDIKRRGKFLIFIFKNHSLLVHLRMEGKFYIKPIEEVKDKHEHVIFKLNDGRSVRYHDTRKFGKMILLNTTNIDEIEKSEALKDLGPDANQQINPILFFNKCLSSNKPIKQLLLDQSIVAGIGNIYANEICFAAGVHPLTNSKELSIRDVQKILASMKSILEKAILQGGTTIKSYTSSLGVTGRFQNDLMVQSREGEPCKVCGTMIERIKIDGRSSFYCPNCQKRAYHAFIVGITGSIAAGKTAATYSLQKMYKKVNLIDCDVINREILQPNYSRYEELLERIGQIFPECVDLENKTIDRRDLRNKLLDSDNKFKKGLIENILHPIIIEEVEKRINEFKKHLTKDEIIFVSAPLLVETELFSMVDAIIYIYANPEVRVKRLMDRDDLDLESALSLIQRDPMDENLLRIANRCMKFYIVNNSFDMLTLRKELKKGIKVVGGKNEIQ